MKFTAAPGFKMIARITKLVGGSVLELGKSMGKDTGGQVSAFGEVIDGIMARTSADQLFSLVNDIICSGFVTVNGTKIAHMDDLGQFEESDPFYLGMIIAKEQLTYSFGDAIKKLISQGS